MSNLDELEMNAQKQIKTVVNNVLRRLTPRQWSEMKTNHQLCLMNSETGAIKLLSGESTESPEYPNVKINFAPGLGFRSVALFFSLPSCVDLSELENGIDKRDNAFKASDAHPGGRGDLGMFVHLAKAGPKLIGYPFIAQYLMVSPRRVTEELLREAKLGNLPVLP